jgi:DNA-binding response OmpR family regulator
MDVRLPDIDGREAVGILRRSGFKAPIIVLTGHDTDSDTASTFRPGSKLLLNQEGSKLRLNEKKTSILRYLYRAGERPASRERLLQKVWGYNSRVTTHTLETHLSVKTKDKRVLLLHNGTC